MSHQTPALRSTRAVQPAKAQLSRRRDLTNAAQPSPQHAVTPQHNPLHTSSTPCQHPTCTGCHTLGQGYIGSSNLGWRGGPLLQGGLHDLAAPINQDDLQAAAGGLPVPLVLQAGPQGPAQGFSGPQHLRLEVQAVHHALAEALEPAQRMDQVIHAPTERMPDSALRQGTGCMDQPCRSPVQGRASLC